MTREHYQAFLDYIQLMIGEKMFEEWPESERELAYKIHLKMSELSKLKE